MATAVFRSDPDRIDHTPSSAVVAGQVIVLNEIIGISTQDIPANTLGALAIKGIFEIAKKDSVDTFAVGELVFWDVADNECNADDGNPLAGICVRAAGATAPTVWVAINEGTFIDDD